MYQVTVKGRNLEELKKAVADIHNELSNGVLVGEVEKDLEETKPTAIVTKAKEVVETFKNQEAEYAEEPTHADGEELDVNGLPWDKRIHASTKTKTKDGGWKKKRGLDTYLLAEVENELRTKVDKAVQTVETPEVPELPEVIVPEQPVLNTTSNVEQAPVIETPVQQSAPTSLPVMTPVSGHTLETFQKNFLQVFSSLITEGKLTQEYVNQLKLYFKVNEIWEFNETAVAEIFNMLVENNLIQKV